MKKASVTINMRSAIFCKRLRMKKRKGLVIATFLLLLAFTIAAAQDKWKGTVVKEDDVTVVRNPREPIYRTPVLELKEDMSLGGPDAQGEYAFGAIRNFVVDDDGSLYILDEQNSHIKAFDASGKYLRTIGRKGQGPGDLDGPYYLTLNRTAGELGVLQLSRRISFFKTEGTFLRHQTVIDSTRAQVDSRGNIYIRETARPKRDEWSYDVKKLSMFGSVLGVLASVPGQGYTGKINPFFAVNTFQVDRSDNLVYGDPRTYELLFFDSSEGKLFKKITREYSSVPVTDKDKAKELEKTPPEVRANVVFPKYFPAFNGFFLSDLGHIFVQTREKTENGKLMHDIFDVEGRFISRIPLKSYGIGILKDKYYALEQEEDGFQYVKRYAVTWKIK
jgi:hypothetical protein